MEFCHSSIVDPAAYQTHGLCDGIDLRVSKDAFGEIRGARRCQKDWSRLVGKLGNYNGTLGDPFSFVRVTVPETLPGRLEIVSYANEFAFLYDDTITENLDQDLESHSRQQILEEFALSDPLQAKSSARGQTGAMRKAQGAKQIQAQILAEMLAIDKERAMTTMRSWQKFVQTVSGRQRSEPFSDLEEYLPYRISDAGELFWFGLVTFAMGLTIPEHEMDLCKRLSHPSWAALALTNDLYSWEKERDAAAQAGEPHVVNGIWVLMQKHSVTEAGAKDLCRQKIKDYVVEALRNVEEVKSNPDLSSDLKVYMESILYSISGNLVWSIYCPRYQGEEVSDSGSELKRVNVDVKIAQAA